MHTEYLDNSPKNAVKVVKVKMVIFIFGLCHLLTIYKYKIFII